MCRHVCRASPRVSLVAIARFASSPSRATASFRAVSAVARLMSSFLCGSLACLLNRIFSSLSFQFSSHVLSGLFFYSPHQSSMCRLLHADPQYRRSSRYIDLYAFWCYLPKSITVSHSSSSIVPHSASCRSCRLLSDLL